MPFALDYDGDGNVIGAHFVDELPTTPTRVQIQRRQHDLSDANMWSNDRPGIHSGWQAPSRRFQQTGHAPTPNMRPPVITQHLHQRVPHSQPSSASAVWCSPHAVPVQAFVNQRQVEEPAAQTSIPPRQMARRHSQQLPLRHEEYTTPRAGRRQTHDSQVPAYPMPTPISSPAFNAFSHAMAPPTPMRTPIVYNQVSLPNLLLQPLHQPIEGAASGYDLQPQAMSHSSTTEQTLDLSKPTRFVNQFSAHFCGDTIALASFEALCKKYNRKEITEVDFYVGAYRVLLRDQSGRILPSFLEFLPQSWRNTDLAWLNEAVKAEYQHKVQQSNDENDVAAAASAKAPLRKKKRPINGFTTSSYNESPSTRCDSVRPTVQVAVSTIPNLHPAKEAQASKESKGHSGLVRLPVKAAPEKSGITKSEKKGKKPPKRRDISPEPEAPALKKPRYTYGTTSGSVIPHFGPIYSTRRAVLSRDSRPYIHANCGARFSHPDDVKSHHKARCYGDLKPSAAWDDHTSCKIGYTQLNYTRCKDGFVVLDQESHDKIEEAVAAGLKYAEEKGG